MVTLEVMNNCDKNALTSALKNRKGVTKVELAKETDESFVFTVYGEKGADLRGAISGIVNQQKATLLSMQAKQSSLEDVFRELTK
jgi:hypothetical protein